MNSIDVRRAIASALLAAACAVPAAAQTKTPQPVPDSYEALFQRYLEASRRMPPADAGWMTGLLADARARRVNDLVTIRVLEQIAASGSADATLDKASEGSAGVTSLFGLEKRAPGWIDPGSLFGASSSSGFRGGGATSRTGTLSAVMTARVVEVLPNGDLVLEGVREIDINGDRQIVVLSGVVRPADILPGNVALSTSVGQLRIRYFGRGLMKDNLKPGWLVRILNKIF
jgi:flagellar L-ring protein precursor FlgH